MNALITVLVVVSLALNFALALTIFSGRGKTPVVTPPAVEMPAARPAPAYGAETWTALQSSDLPDMVRRLREGGFPQQAIRAIVAAQLRETYAAREKLIDPDVGKRPFWKAYAFDPQKERARRELYREQQKTLRELFGPDDDSRESVNALFRGRRFDSVPPEKVESVQRILQEFEDARTDLFMSTGGGMIGAEGQKRLAALEKEQRAALGGVLTPQELQEWEIRNSDTARNVRMQLEAFQPTESEFRAVYRLQSEFDEQFGRTYSIPSPEEQQRRSEAQQRLNEQIKAALGPVRAADFEKSSNFEYRQTSQLVARLELPPATVGQVQAIRDDIRNKLNDVMRTQHSVEERDRRLAQLASETETRIGALLGARGFEAYRQYGGMWMQMLKPRPAPNAPAGTPAR